MKSSLYAVTAVVMVASAPVRAQQPARSRDVRPAPSCSEAISTMRASSSGPEGRRALDRLPGCGEAAYSAVAQSILQERTSRDITQLGRLHRFVQVSPRGGILDAILAVAQDNSASVEARVSALAVLTGELHRDMMVSYHAVAGGLDPAGMPVNGCSSGRLAGDYGPSQLTHADVERVRQVAWALRRNKAEPPDVRSAATCVL
jgi:hypothetical protein